MPPASLQRFEKLRVLEIAGSFAGVVTGRLFADVGARVTRIERPGPLAGRGRHDLVRELAEADVLIESAAPGPLHALGPAAGHDRLIRVIMSPFGSSGPLAALRSNDFTDEAIGGHLLLNGEPDRQPIAHPAPLASYQAGLHGFVAALAMLRQRDATGRGRSVEISHFEGLVAIHQHTLTMWTHDRHVLRREGNRQPGYWHPAGVYPCRDGHVVLNVVGQAARDRLLAATDLAEALLDPRFSNDLAVARHKDELDALLEPWLRAHSANEIVDVLQRARVAVARVLKPSEVLSDPQLVARGAFVEVDALRVPAAPFTVHAHRIDPRDDVTEHATSRARGAKTHSRRSQPPGVVDLPLAGVRVLDLGRAWAGPLAGRVLSDLGADVIAVEAPDARGGRTTPDGLAEVTHLFPDGEVGPEPWNRIGSLNALLRGKRAITLDLRRAEARSVFESLITHADVLLENASPGVLAGIGLDVDRLGELNPALIVTSITGFGSSGPDANHVAFGPTVEARAGVTHGTGYADTGPYRSGLAWPDPLAALHAVSGTLAALHDRDATRPPRVRHVEVSMLESTLSVVADELIAAQSAAGDPPRRGARHAKHAPQGVYPCAGSDRWIAISVMSDAEWRALCATLNLGAALPCLDGHERRARHDVLDAAISERTRHEDRVALTHRLQAAGVIACWLSDARDLCESGQLADRGFWIESTADHRPDHREPGLPFHPRAEASPRRTLPPRLGEHNREVLREWLGFSDARLAQLESIGVLVDAPPE